MTREVARIEAIGRVARRAIRYADCVCYRIDCIEASVVTLKIVLSIF